MVLTLDRALSGLLQVNQIPLIQVSEKQLARLSAQRALYAKAKVLLATQMIMSVPFAVLWSLLGIFAPETKIGASVWGISIFLLDQLFFVPRQKTLKGKAARIQEAFDCDVLSLPWRSIRAGSHPDPEDVIEWARKSTPARDAQLTGWYPPAVGALPLALARAICQRANCWWDGALRLRYAHVTIAVVVAVFSICLISGIVGHFTIEQWILSGIAPLLPVFTLGLRQFAEQKEAAERLDTLKRHAEKMWGDLLDGAPDEKSTQLARELQDEIFDHRRRNPLIFDWVYQRLRKGHEERMNRSAAELVEEARNKLSIS